MVIFFFMVDDVDLVCLAVISSLRGFKDLHAALRETDGKSIGYLMACNFT